MVELLSTTLLILTATLFCIGILIGWMMSNHGTINTENNLRTVVAIVVMIGWISATIAGILIATYSVSPLLHALMGAIVGYFFTDDGIIFNVGEK